MVNNCKVEGFKKILNKHLKVLHAFKLNLLHFLHFNVIKAASLFGYFSTSLTHLETDLFAHFIGKQLR